MCARVCIRHVFIVFVHMCMSVCVLCTGECVYHACMQNSIRRTECIFTVAVGVFVKAEFEVTLESHVDSGLSVYRGQFLKDTGFLLPVAWE